MLAVLGSEMADLKISELSALTLAMGDGLME